MLKIKYRESNMMFGRHGDHRCKDGYKKRWKILRSHCRDIQGHPRIFYCIGSKMFLYALLVLCAAQFLVPEVSSINCKDSSCNPWWKKRGCRIDYHRDLTALFDDRQPDSQCKVDWDDFSGYLHGLACRCRAAAIKAGNTWFALENYGVCFSAKGSFTQYLAKYSLDAEARCVGVLKHNNTIVSQEDGEICVGGYYRAYFYEITNIGQAPALAPEEEEEEVIRCKAISDVVFMIDVSGSIGDEDFKLVKEFLQKFLDAYDFSNGKSRFGIITFDEKCYVDLTWMDSSAMTLVQMRDIINGLKYTGGSTMTDNALKCAREKIIDISQRAGVPKTVIVMTDGRSWNGYNKMPAPSNALRGMGCKMLAIGIGSVDQHGLEIITGATDQIFLLDSFRTLINYAAKHINKILSKACVP